MSILLLLIISTIIVSAFLLKSYSSKMLKTYPFICNNTKNKLDILKKFKVKIFLLVFFVSVPLSCIFKYLLFSGVKHSDYTFNMMYAQGSLLVLIDFIADKFLICSIVLKGFVNLNMHQVIFGPIRPNIPTQSKAECLAIVYCKGDEATTSTPID